MDIENISVCQMAKYSSHFECRIFFVEITENQSKVLEMKRGTACISQIFNIFKKKIGIFYPEKTSWT